MAYLPNIPAAADQISTSQGQIQGNFQSIGTVFDQNHADFNAGAGTAGQHTFVQLQPQAPTPAFAGIPGFWSSTAAGNPIMAHNAAGNDFDITTLVNSIVTGDYGQGSLTLPCGLIMKFGKQQASGTGIDSINFTNAFSANGQCAAFVSIISVNLPQIATAVVYSLSNTKLQAKVTNYAGTAYHAGSYYWFAIGV
jgi:hypothetical protein